MSPVFDAVFLCAGCAPFQVMAIETVTFEIDTFVSSTHSKLDTPPSDSGARLFIADCDPYAPCRRVCSFIEHRTLVPNYSFCKSA